jgi:hypothetical protein
MTALVYFMNEHWSTLVFVSNLLYGSGLALLEDERKFKLGDVLALIKCQFLTCG